MAWGYVRPGRGFDGPVQALRRGVVLPSPVPAPTGPLVGVSGVTSTGVLSTTVVPLPARHEEGDALVVLVCLNQATATIDAPDGWAALGDATTGSNLTSRAFWRRAPEGGAGPSVSVSHSSNRRTSAVAAAVRGSGDPVVEAKTSAGGTVSTSAVTLGEDGSLVLALVGYRTGGMTWTPTAGWRQRAAYDGGGTNTGARLAQRRELATAGELASENVWATSFTNWDLYTLGFEPASP